MQYGASEYTMADIRVWSRIERELRRRGKEPQWLAEKLGWDQQRINNWKTRGVPVKVFPDIAAVLQVPINWIAGSIQELPDEIQLTEAERRLVLELRRLAAAEREKSNPAQ